MSSFAESSQEFGKAKSSSSIKKLLPGVKADIKACVTEIKPDALEHLKPKVLTTLAKDAIADAQFTLNRIDTILRVVKRWLQELQDKLNQSIKAHIRQDLGAFTAELDRGTEQVISDTVKEVLAERQTNFLSNLETLEGELENSLQSMDFERLLCFPEVLHTSTT